LHDLKHYGFEREYDEVINELALELGKKELVAGRLEKVNDGAFVLYRAKADYLARVIAQKNPGATWHLNLKWDENGQAMESITVWDNNNQITSSSTSSSLSLRKIFEDARVLQEVSRQFVKVQEKENLGQSATLEDYLAKYDITEFPVVTNLIYGKTGKINIDAQTGDVQADVKYSIEIEKRVVVYLMQNDPLGRTLMVKYDTLDGFDFVLYYYPDGAISASATIPFKIRNRSFGKVAERWFGKSVEMGDINLFDRYIPSSRNTVFKTKNGFTLESEYMPSGILARKQYPAVGHYFAQIPVMTKGIEETIYNTETPLEIPAKSYYDGKEIKTWENIEINLRGDESKYYVHTISEKNQLAPGKTQTFEYYYDKFGKYQGKKLLRSSDDLSWNDIAKIFAVGVAAAVILFGILRFFGYAALKRAQNRYKGLGKTGKIKNSDELHKQLLDNLGVIKVELNHWKGIGLLNEGDVLDLNNQIDATITELDKIKTSTTLTKGEKALAKTKVMDNLLSGLISKLQNQLYGNSDQKRDAVKRILRGWGFYFDKINLDFDALKDLPGQGADLRAFLRWLKYSEAADRNAIENFLKGNPLLSIMLIEIVEDEVGKYFRADAGAVRYYLTYSLLHDLMGGVTKADLRKNLLIQRDKILDFMKSMKATTKNQKIIFEDLRYIFKTIGKIQEFMSLFNICIEPLNKAAKAQKAEIDKQTIPAEEKDKLKKRADEELAKGLKKLREEEVLTKIKPRILWNFVYKDKPVWAFFIGLWMPILVLVTAVLLNFVPAILSGVFGVKLSAVVCSGSEIIGSLGLSAVFTLSMFLITKCLDRLNSMGNDSIKKDYLDPLSKSNENTAVLPFWVFFGITLFIGAFANYWMLKWTFTVIAQLMHYGAWATIVFAF
ncbi:MAG: hypothetical protein KJ880_04315, partial [Candidatus Omnitrophica bacterium]|nr:hypothetical protein [Candidatus Omnitrophota bacterium]